jgi:hypothetical protein
MSLFALEIKDLEGVWLKQPDSEQEKRHAKGKYSLGDYQIIEFGKDGGFIYQNGRSVREFKYRLFKSDSKYIMLIMWLERDDSVTVIEDVEEIGSDIKIGLSLFSSVDEIK